MAYGFNDDKSKQDVYSKSEIDSMLAEIAGNANRLLTPNLRSWATLKSSVSVPANTTQYIELCLPQDRINEIKNNFGNDAKIRVTGLTGLQAWGTNPSTQTHEHNLIVSRLAVSNASSNYFTPTVNTVIFTGNIYNPNSYEITLDDFFVVYFNYVVLAS